MKTGPAEPGVINQVAGAAIELTAKALAFVGVRGPLTGVRHHAVRGVWSGAIEQPDHPQGLDHAAVTLTLRTRFKKVHGRAFLVVSPPTGGPTLEAISMTIRVTGGFQEESFMKLDYVNSDSNVLQFGTMLMRLDATGEMLEGRFVGYGHFAQRLVHGTCHLRKEPATPSWRRFRKDRHTVSIRKTLADRLTQRGRQGGGRPSPV